MNAWEYTMYDGILESKNEKEKKEKEQKERKETRQVCQWWQYWGNIIIKINRYLKSLNTTDCTDNYIISLKTNINIRYQCKS